MWTVGEGHAQHKMGHFNVHECNDRTLWWARAEVTNVLAPSLAAAARLDVAAIRGWAFGLIDSKAFGKQSCENAFVYANGFMFFQIA